MSARVKVGGQESFLNRLLVLREQQEVLNLSKKLHHQTAFNSDGGSGVSEGSSLGNPEARPQHSVFALPLPPPPRRPHLPPPPPRRPHLPPPPPPPPATHHLPPPLKPRLHLPPPDPPGFLADPRLQYDPSRDDQSRYYRDQEQGALEQRHYTYDDPRVETYDHRYPIGRGKEEERDDDRWGNLDLRIDEQQVVSEERPDEGEVSDEMSERLQQVEKQVQQQVEQQQQQQHQVALAARALLNSLARPQPTPPLLPFPNLPPEKLVDSQNVLARALASAAPRKPRGEKKPIPDTLKDEKYFERRKRNNLAAKKSRDARKMREDQTTTMRPALLLCVLSVVASSHGRRSRRDLLAAADDKDAANHPASPRDLVAAADTSVSRQSPSSANSPPNSWLYKFPPWFLPGNPAPDGFHSLQGKFQAAAKEFSMVDDGDVLIIDHFGSDERTGRLGNVRVPGNSAFRDAVVQTVLNVKYGKSQSPSSPGGSNSDNSGVSGQVVTPWLVPQSVPEPPLPSPTPTVPITLHQSHGRDPGFDNNLVTGRPQEKREPANTSLRQSNDFPIINNGDDFLSKVIRTDSRPSDTRDIKFQPSPPDVYQTTRPNNVAQEGHSSAVISGFRPSKLVSVTLGDQGSLQHGNAGGVTKPAVSQSQQHNPGNNIHHDNVNNSFLKVQQAALLKASDRPQSARHPQSTSGQTKQLVVPFLPGIPLPLLLQHSQRLSQIGRQPSLQVTLAHVQHRQRSGRDQGGVVNDLRKQQQTPGSAPLPTSIQDIINGDYDTAQTLYHTGRDPGITSTAHSKPTGAGGTDTDNQWLWRAS
ncbi:uncharacterized protein [Panulirus ornatus]|uniref:uncharacterized protein n=1 Tax=Panulirus ornatus TaxID=150431 RepID=UPI003A8A8514